MQMYIQHAVMQHTKKKVKSHAKLKMEKKISARTSNRNHGNENKNKLASYASSAIAILGR